MKTWLSILTALIFFSINTYAENIKDEGVIGIEYDNNTYEILDINKKTNAYKSGLREGDIIKEINTVNTFNISNDDFYNLLQGDPNTYLRLVVERNNQSIEINFLRNSLFDLYDCKDESLSSEEIHSIVIYYNQKNFTSKVFECTKIGHERGFTYHTSNLGFLYATGFLGHEIDYKKGVKLSQQAIDARGY